jgi:hypothetical protein
MMSSGRVTTVGRDIEPGVLMAESIVDFVYEGEVHQSSVER